MPDPNTIGWRALKDGQYVAFKPSHENSCPLSAGNYFFEKFGFGVSFHHGNRAGLHAPPVTAALPDGE